MKNMLAFLYEQSTATLSSPPCLPLRFLFFILYGSCISLVSFAQESSCKDPLLVEEPSTLGTKFAISSDNILVATDADDGFGAVMDITVRNLASGDAIRRWSFPKEQLRKLCFVDKSRLLVAGSDSGTLRVLNPDTGEMLTQTNEIIFSPILGFDCPANGGATVSQYAIPSGTIEWLSAKMEPLGKYQTGPGTTLIASSTLPHQALVLTKTELAKQPPDLKDLLEESSGGDQTTTRFELRMVSAQNNAVLWRNDLKETPLDAVLLDSSGNVGAWMDKEGYLHIINAQDGKETHRVQLASLSFPQFTFSEQGRFLAISELGEWHSFVIDTDSGKVINQLQTEEILALRKDGSPLLLRKLGNAGIEIALSGTNGTAQRIQGRLQTPSLVAQPTGRLFFSGQQFDYLLNVKERTITQLIKPAEVNVTLAASVTPDSILRIYERSDGDWSIGNQDGKDEPVRLPPNSRGLAVTTLAQGSGLLMASVKADDLERIKTAVDAWSDTLGNGVERSELNSVLLSTNTTLYQVDFTGAAKKMQSLQGAVSAMQISNDQKSFARFQPPHLQVLDVNSGRSEFKTAISDITTTIKFSPTHSWIAFTRDAGIEVRDWRKDSLVTRITRDRDLGEGFEFSADGESLIYADGATVHVASLSSPSTSKSSAPNMKSIEYTADGAVETIAVLNDKFFAGVSSSGAVNVWKVGHPAPVARLVFERNGTWTVIDDRGRFDTSSIETNHAVHVFNKGGTANQLMPSDCRGTVWVPGLLSEVFDDNASVE